MSYQRPHDPYIHSNASQYDERYQQGGAGYRDYPERGNEGYYGGQQDTSRNAATQAAATYSYAKPKKGVSKWIKIGIPVAIIIIAGAVLGGIFGSRAANNNDSNSSGGSSSQGNSGQGSQANVDSNTLSAAQQAAKNGGNNQLFYKGTDPYGNPSFVTGQVDTSAPSLNGNSHGNCNDPWSPTNSLTNLRDHPRLIAPQYQWDCLPERIRNDAYLTVWNETIFNNATEWAKEDPVAYSIDGDSGLLDVSREIQQRVKTWAYAFKVSGNQQFKDRLYLELNTAAGNTDAPFGQNGTRWNPTHFLDVAEMTAAFAIGYDWLYNDWSDSERSMIRTAIIQYGLTPGQQAYANNEAWWSQTNNGNGNWNCVCNGGLIVGALAVYGDDNSDVIGSILNTALENMRSNCMRGAYSDGTWSETPNYWYFGTNAQARALSSLTTATGNDQGLMAANSNWLKTTDFHMYVTGHAGMFAYGDNGPNKFATTANQLMLYSRLANDPRGALFQRDRADASFDPLSMFWYDERSIGAFWNGLALDRFFNNTDGGQWASMRSSWTDPNAVYVGIKSSNATGHQTHGDLDAGDFVIDALGTRWAGEYGNGNYLSKDYFASEAADAARWTYYRKATQGQNTLVINNENQVPNCYPDNDMSSTNAAQSGDINYKPGTNDVAFFRTDMSSCYGLNNGAVRRGIRVLNGRRQVLVQDEIAQNGQINNIKWRVQTNGTVESTSSDGRTVTLSIDSVTGPNAGAFVGDLTDPVPLPGGKKTMVVKILEPAGARFTTTSPPERIYGEATASDNGQQSDQPNPGVTVLQIELDGGSAQRISVVWQPQWSDLSDADRADPPSVALDSWTLTSHNA